MGTYKGPVVFVHPHDDNGVVVGDGAQGCHYPVDEDGHADMSRPLFWDADKAAYRDKTDTDPTHFDAYHQNHVELQIGGETIGVSDEDAEAVKKFLADRKGGE